MSINHCFVSRTMKDLRSFSQLQANKLVCHSSVNANQRQIWDSDGKNSLLLIAIEIDRERLFSGLNSPTPVSTGDRMRARWYQLITFQEKNPKIRKPQFCIMDRTQTHCSTFAPEGDIIFIALYSKRTYLLLWRKTLSPSL